MLFREHGEALLVTGADVLLKTVLDRSSFHVDWGSFRSRSGRTVHWRCSRGSFRVLIRIGVLRLTAGVIRRVHGDIETWNQFRRP